MKYEVAVIGLGYIGLPTAVLIASKKLNVLGVEVNENVIEKLTAAISHINEPFLDELLVNVIDNKLLTVRNAPSKSKVFVITVPTPFKDKKNNIPQPDLSYVDAAMNSISSYIEKGDLIILESTIPVGATERFALELTKIRSDLNLNFKASENIDVNIAHCPERVLPGNIMKEIVENDRIVGGLTKKCSEKARAFYEKFVKGKIHETSSKTAELTKLSENSFRDVQIAFANELSIICDSAGINVRELISLANKHPRVNILQPGPGVGGHCIAVDPWFIASSYPKESKMIQLARKVNNEKPAWVIKKIENQLEKINNNPNKKKITLGFFGLAYKPNIDDLRESPSLQIAKYFSKKKNILCKTIEPNISSKEVVPGIENIPLERALDEIDIAILLVNHSEFQDISQNDYLAIMDFTGVLSNY